MTQERVHFIGIGGSGLSAIARLVAESGVPVSGSDRSLTPLARELQAAGIRVAIGHSPSNVVGASLVVRSSAIPDDNPEVITALAAGIPVLKRSEYLGRLLQGRQTIAVAGTHGKTTTTAMLAWMLFSLKLDPSYIIGGVSLDLGGNAHAGKGASFVIEADEYDRMFLGLDPAIAIVTYLEHDHPDCYPTPEEYRAAFVSFIERIQPGGTLLVCADQPATAGLASALTPGRRAFTYALHTAAAYTARELRVNAGGGSAFDAYFNPAGAPPIRLASLDLRVPGEHNAANALAALAVAHCLRLPLDAASIALNAFRGTGRRFDLRGEINGIAIIDDYAHHPTEIRSTLSAARARYPGRRIWAVWQPHTFSRTTALLPEFAAAFELADCVIVTEVYAAREAPGSFSAAQVLEHMAHPNARFISALDDAASLLTRELLPGDVLLVLSAGDADQVSVRVISDLKEMFPQAGSLPENGAPGEGERDEHA